MFCTESKLVHTIQHTKQVIFATLAMSLRNISSKLVNNCINVSITYPLQLTINKRHLW